MHYLIIIVIITIIVFIQLRIFLDTKQKISAFLWMFPEKSTEYKLEKEALIEKINSAQDDELDEMLKAALFKKSYHYTRLADDDKEIDCFRREEARKDLIKKISLESNGIYVSHNNETLTTIVESINDYLRNNKAVSDFHLMKDIVDRNCDTKEEEIQTQIPIPLYMGLVGTMAGILIGIMYLWLSGGISNLLSGSGSGADGIEALLGGVSLAMISSIFGIILTTWGSYEFKNAKSDLESNKHTLLSWIQAKLLPTLSDNVVGAIREMTSNLDNFNKEFAHNTGNLGTALTQVNESYKMQVRLLDSVRQIADKDLTQQNLQLYTALQNSTEEIGTLGEYLKSSNHYLANVQALNKKLDDYENRTQFIENASKFYSKHENWLSENYDDANRKLHEVVSKYNTVIEDVFNTIKSDIEGKRQEFGTFIESQNSALKQSSGDLDKIIKALSELGEVQKGVKAFESAIKGQNAKIDQLTNYIEKLANAKSTGSTVQIQQKTPMLQRVLIIIITLSCMTLAVNSFFKSGSKVEKTEFTESQSDKQHLDIPISRDSVKIVNSAVHNNNN